MNYYKDENGKVYAFNDLQVKQCIPDKKGLTAITDEEAAEILTVEETTPTDEEQEVSRSIAYANVTTGSDRLFQSYQAAIANDKDDETIEAKKTAWLARRQEIQEEYPLSTD